ncbi:MAG: aspartate--tRNA ligase [Clostridia bacterium]|nr:aspartate--tRNA ligase [Clostridia bacterium]
MSAYLAGWKRTHLCSAVANAQPGEAVTVMGWVQKRRNLGGLVFIDLRDYTGIVQVVVDAARAGQAAFDEAGDARGESVMAFRGTVSARVGNQINRELATGHVEILCDELKTLSQSAVLPYNLDDPRTSDALKYKHRYLGLRSPELQRNLRMRHTICRTVRDYLDANGFCEIETPMLCRSTPEGARDYLVPSRVSPGQFYALPQSPQIYKQLLMVAGCDRYYQLARCFRDEDLRADRQPEFTQIDLEMSFVDQEDVLELVEGMLQTVLPSCALSLASEGKGFGGNPAASALSGRAFPWPRLTYAVAMEDYGSDKPDIRFELKLKTVNSVFASSEHPLWQPGKAGRIAALCVPTGGSLTRKEIDALAEVAKTYKAGGLAWYVPGDPPRGSILKALSPEEAQELCAAFGASHGDLILLVSDGDAETASTALGQVRLALGKQLSLYNPAAFAPLWVTDFPLLEFADGRWYAKHHPFTMPMEEDIPLLSADPGRVRAKAYDAVLNGVEIGGGSIRIHNSELQQQMLEVLGFAPEEAKKQFGFLMEALSFGTPPHGGFAAGLDRLAMLLCGVPSIREVIAFPKMQNARDLMSDAPNVVDGEQLEVLGLRIADVIEKS